MDRERFINANNEIVDYWGYLNSIDWYDPWLILLIISHILVTTAAATTRNHSFIQIILFLIMLTLVFMAERINDIAAENWQLFSRQLYFDKSGLFISTVFSLPILLNCMLMIANWLHTATQLMSTMRVVQLKATRNLHVKTK